MMGGRRGSTPAIITVIAKNKRVFLFWMSVDLRRNEGLICAMAARIGLRLMSVYLDIAEVKEWRGTEVARGGGWSLEERGWNLSI